MLSPSVGSRRPPMSITASDPRRAAANALWYALEERRDQIRAAGLRFGERQHHQMREAHDEGRLLDWMCKAMENHKDKPPRNPANLAAMAKVIKSGLPTWEHVLIRRGEPWAPYVTPKARLGAQLSIAGAKAYTPFI